MGQAMCKNILWKAKEVKILMVGLDAAGKTTILYTLKLGEVVTTIPTIGFNIETVEHKNQSLTVWDVGGRGKARFLYRHYYASTNAVIFVIDSNDHERLDEALEECNTVISETELADCTFLILCNKQDLENAFTVEDVKEKLKSHPSEKVGVFPVVALDRKTLKEPLNWLTDTIANKKTKYLADEAVAQAKEIVKPVFSPSNYFKQSWNYVKSYFP
ncbi:hypothetical protein SNE40_007602 [Patella caerulea]|uniref:ADP-ribosylation factor n=1 Tax=Patella caerulea TaxID=87958 RepID=A0AAN8JYU7_PATCE